MSKEELKYEINKELENFSHNALQELLRILKENDAKEKHSFSNDQLNHILAEDHELLRKLAQ
ncbi:MAG: hypothetical protein ABR502_08555 [Chitinophagaceae bacterium]